MESSSSDTSYSEGFEHGKETKLREILPFQAREHVLFLSGQCSFYHSFHETLTLIIPNLKLTEAKTNK